MSTQLNFLPSTNINADGNGSAIDCNSAAYSLYVVQNVGDLDDVYEFTGKMQESDDGVSGWTDVASGSFTLVTAQNDLQLIKITRTKRYLRYSYSFSVTGSGLGYFLGVHGGDTYDLSTANKLAALPTTTLSSTTNGPAKDCTGMPRSMLMIMSSGDLVDTGTLDAKIQEANFGVGPWTDVSGAVFTQVTAANSLQLLTFTRTQTYVRINITIGGTPVFTIGAFLDTIPDAMSPLLAAMATAMKRICYKQTSTLTRRIFAPVAQITRIIPVMRASKTRIVQSPPIRMLTPAFPRGPIGYVPIKAPAKMHFRPERRSYRIRAVSFQTFVTIHGQQKTVKTPTVTRYRTRLAPIQPAQVPVFKSHLRLGFHDRVRPGRTQVIERPPNTLIVNRIKVGEPDQIVRNVRRLVPGGIQYVGVPIYTKSPQRVVLPPPIVVKAHAAVITPPRQIVPLPRGIRLSIPPARTIKTHPSVVAQPPLIITRKSVRQVTKTVAMPSRSRVIQAPPGVLAMHKMRLFHLRPAPPRHRFPFAVDRPVTVNVPFPVVLRYPRPYIGRYHKRVPVASVIAPPPVVQNVICPTRRVVR